MTNTYSKAWSNTDMNYSELRPKTSVGEPTIGSRKLQISKEWMLPPKVKPGRRPRASPIKEHKEVSSEEPCEIIKKKKNREAQRAYRERRASQLQDLQDLVDKWKDRCHNLKYQLKKSEENTERCEKRNAELIAKLKKYESQEESSKCGMCLKDACVCKDIGLDSSASFLDPIFQQKINNFKPMKAVSLKNTHNKRNHSPSTLPVFKRAKPAQVTLESSPGIVHESLQFQVSNQGCGFCSEGSTCVCKELDTQVLHPPIAEEVQGLEESCKVEPGSCEQCQRDPQRKQFCQSVNEISSLKSDCCGGEMIPINDAYLRIRKHMDNTAIFEGSSNSNETAPTPSHFSIVSQLNMRGGQVELKSVIDVLRQMDRNLFT